MRKSKKTGPSYNTPQGLKTRKNILLAAGKVFSDKGYQGATIELIAKQAKVVVSMVMHHFGSKENLYAEVIRCFILDSGCLEYIFSPLMNQEMSTVQEVDQAIAECVLRYLCKSRPEDPSFIRWLGVRLLMDDVPSVHKTGLEAMKEVKEKFVPVLRRVYPQLSDDRLQRWIHTYWSLLFFPTVAGKAICMQNDWKRYPDGFLEQWAVDIAFYSSTALKALASRGR